MTSFMAKLGMSCSWVRGLRVTGSKWPTRCNNRVKSVQWPEYTLISPVSMGPPYLQVLLNVLAVIGDTTGRNAGFPHQLKADLATQVVRDISLLQHKGEDVWNWKGGGSPYQQLPMSFQGSSPFFSHPPERRAHPCLPCIYPAELSAMCGQLLSPPPHRHTHSLSTRASCHAWATDPP